MSRGILTRIAARAGKAVGRTRRWLHEHRWSLAALALSGVLYLRGDLLVEYGGKLYGIGPRGTVSGLDTERAVDVPIQ